MADRRQLVRLAAAAGVAAAGGAILQRQHTRRIAADPERALLDAPPGGEPLNIRSADGTELYAESFAPLVEFGWAPLRALREIPCPPHVGRPGQPAARS